MTFASGPLPKAGRGAVVMGGTRNDAWREAKRRGGYGFAPVPVGEGGAVKEGLAVGDDYREISPLLRT